jgi:hypothetical protein
MIHTIAINMRIAPGIRNGQSIQPINKTKSDKNRTTIPSYFIFGGAAALAAWLA